jgi:hypothetical protein
MVCTPSSSRNPSVSDVGAKVTVPFRFGRGSGVVSVPFSVVIETFRTFTRAQLTVAL